MHNLICDVNVNFFGLHYFSFQIFHYDFIIYMYTYLTNIAALVSCTGGFGEFGEFKHGN